MKNKKLVRCIITTILIIAVTSSQPVGAGVWGQHIWPSWKNVLKTYGDIEIWDEDRDIDPSIEDWYGVSKEEIEICSKWGGTETAQKGGSLSSPIELSQLTLTLQAQKKTMPDNTTLYEISWYIQPVKNPVDYEVVLTGDGTYNITEGEASYENAGVGYFTQYLEASYNQAELRSSITVLTAPIT